LQELLNESGTTKVYRAHQTALNRTVLVKILHKHLTSDTDFSTRFEREAHAIAQIKSEHIVQVYDLTDVDGAPAIVMEFVEGTSLKMYLEQYGIQDIDFARVLAQQILQGLAVAHGRGIIHRDIKPGNIIVERSDSFKITDFGLAALALAPTVTMDGMVLGTPAYMSPEQARGEIVDARSDFFSLGLTLLECLSGKRIFDGQSYSECLTKTLKFDVQQLDQELRSIEPHFGLFLRKMLIPDRNQRFASAHEALEFLVGHQSLLPIKRIRSSRKYLVAAIVFIVSVAALSLLVVQNHQFDTPSHLDIDTTANAKADDTSLSSPLKMQKDSAATTPVRVRNLAETSQQSSAQNAPAADASRSDSAQLIISCTPWAKVYINNTYIGETPIADPLWVPLGQVSVTFSNPLFSPITRLITAQANTRIPVEANFLENAGYVMINVSPWAEVYIDDQYRDTTPLSKPLLMTVGVRKLRLHNPMFADITREITVEHNDTISLTINLSQGVRR
jgi:serine/threonine-protein kinase